MNTVGWRMPRVDWMMLFIAVVRGGAGGLAKAMFDMAGMAGCERS